LEAWKKLISPKGRFIKVDGVVVTLRHDGPGVCEQWPAGPRLPQHPRCL